MGGDHSINKAFIDCEVLKRSHRFWASDNNDALGATPSSAA
jgi:alpha-galactosidase